MSPSDTTDATPGTDPAPSRLPRIRPEVRFPILFLALSFLLLYLADGPLADTIRPWLCDLVALHSHGLLNLLGESTRLHDNVVAAPSRGHSFEVIYACTALPATILLVSAILAFPASWTRRLVGLLAGVATLYVVNLLRLVVLFYCFLYWRSFYDRMHHTVWQGLLVILAVGFFCAWALIGRKRVSDA